MFSADLAGCEDGALRTAGEAALAVLRGTIARGVQAGDLRPDPAGTHALAAWSLVHGLAMLMLDGKIPGQANGAGPDALMGPVGAALIEGLAAPRA